MPSQKDIAAESGAPMIPEQRRELMLRQSVSYTHLTLPTNREV